MIIRYEASAYKDLKKITPLHKRKIIQRITHLAEYPLAGKRLNGRYKGLRSFRIWPYRIIYEIKGKTINIYTIKHRQGVYK